MPRFGFFVLVFFGTENVRKFSRSWNFTLDSFLAQQQSENSCVIVACDDFSEMLEISSCLKNFGTTRFLFGFLTHRIFQSPLHSPHERFKPFTEFLLFLIYVPELIGQSLMLFICQQSVLSSKTSRTSQ